MSSSRSQNETIVSFAQARGLCVHKVRPRRRYVKQRSRPWVIWRRNCGGLIAGPNLDLETLFNWNTKQVFAYITASYPGKKYVRRPLPYHPHHPHHPHHPQSSSTTNPTPGKQRRRHLGLHHRVQRKREIKAAKRPREVPDQRYNGEVQPWRERYVDVCVERAAACGHTVVGREGDGGV